MRTRRSRRLSKKQRMVRQYAKIYGILLIIALSATLVVHASKRNNLSDTKEEKTSITLTVNETTPSMEGVVPETKPLPLMETISAPVEEVGGEETTAAASAEEETLSAEEKYWGTDYIFNEVQFALTRSNVRAEPDIESKILGKVNAGDPVFITSHGCGADGKWDHIRFQNKEAFIYDGCVGTKEEYEAYKKAHADNTPYSTELNKKYAFDYNKQKFLFNMCAKVFPDDVDKQKEYYAYTLGVIEQESTFRQVKGYNSNGTVDVGLMQINSSRWKEMKDLGIIDSYVKNSSCDELQYDDYKNITAGMHELNACINKWGISQEAYYMYNTGKKKTKGTNKNSQKVWKYYQNWREILEL